MPSLKERVTSYLQSLIPVQRRTIYNDRYTPRFVAAAMDVDRVQSIVEGAEDGDTRELFSLYREIVLTDAHLQNEFGKRKLAVLGDALSIQPRDKKQAEDKKAAEAIDAMIEGYEGWEDACIHLLDSTLLPVAVIEEGVPAEHGGRAAL
ncbi:MAG: DUF935 family protein [Bryobacteraceae bacterium]|nr:DUF935 family protein [Bryobacteraceae bacterium]